MDINNQSLTATQLPLIDIAGGVSFPKEKKKLKTQKLKVNDMLAQVRQLHEQINTYLHKCPVAERPSINSPTDAAELVKPFIGNLDHEELWIIVLDRRNRVIQFVRLYQGSVSSSHVRVGEVFRQAIIEQASGLKSYDIQWVDPETFLPFPYNQVEYLWREGVSLSPMTIGVHWFGGDWTSIDQEEKANEEWASTSRCIVARA